MSTGPIGMASSKEIPHSARPVSQHRSSLSSTLGAPLRASYGRQHSHSLSTGSLNPNHRVTRRKSVTNNNANLAAITAAARDISEGTGASSKRNTMSRSYGSKTQTPPSSLPSNRLSAGARPRAEKDEGAIEDDEDDGEVDEDGLEFEKSRARRASDGQQGRIEGKRNKEDLRCTKCGKNYKHSSCLTKHLWEHTPEWSYTSKLLISKHQQVQLLEAASVLVAMNTDEPAVPEATRDSPSDPDSASPAASGSSGQHDGTSSADTTPPPQERHTTKSYYGDTYTAKTKRYSSGNNFSRSYQSAPSAKTSVAGSAPRESTFSQYWKQNGDRRPLSSGLTTGGQDDEAGLAAAVELLSCSFGTPRSVPVTLPADVPPVPPLPAQYLSQNALSGLTISSLRYTPSASTSYLRGAGHQDVKMEDANVLSHEDDEHEMCMREPIDEDEEGVFGRMDEE